MFNVVGFSSVACTSAYVLPWWSSRRVTASDDAASRASLQKPGITRSASVGTFLLIATANASSM